MKMAEEMKEAEALLALSASPSLGVGLTKDEEGAVRALYGLSFMR